MNQILLIDKEEGYTSFDVCHKLKRKFNTKKIGHTGTLDPNATGLLMVMINKSCKILPYIKHAKKTYRASMRFGLKTDTKDIWGQIIEEQMINEPTIDQIKQVLLSFMGPQLQIPPMTSAIKVNGKKLYELQRANIDYQPEPRKIEIYELNFIKYDQELYFEVTCSAGTYIRSLCEDIALKLNNLGTMTSLVRTKIDDFDVKDAKKLDDIINDHYQGLNNEEILSKYYPLIEYHDLKDIINGKRISLDCNQDIVMITHDHKIVAAYEKEKDQIYKSKRGLW